MAELFREVIDQAKAAGRTYLMEHESKAVLESLGITTSKSIVARSEDEAVEIFQSLASPAALKVLSPDVVHKSDAGGVKLNLKDADEVRAAYRDIARAFQGQKVEGVSVQKMARPGVEAIVGVTNDATFGPMLMFGLGGVFVEVLKDVSFRSIPISESDARGYDRGDQRLCPSQRFSRLLCRYQGSEGSADDDIGLCGEESRYLGDGSQSRIPLSGGLHGG